MIPTLARKITLKTLGLTAKVNELKRKGEVGETYFIAVMYGRAGEVRRGQTVLPDGKVSQWCSLIGQFEATVHGSNNPPVQASELFIPGGFEKAIIGLLSTGNQFVDFAFEIGVTVTATNIGFEYVVRNLLATKGVDPMSEIRAEMLKTLETGAVSKQIEAPPAEPAPEPAAKKSVAEKPKKG